MKTTKKVLSVLLAAIVLMSAAMTGVSALPRSKDYPGGLNVDTTIDRVDITLRTDIAGKSSWDYKEIYTIETAHVSYHDNGFYSGNPGFGIYDKNGFINDYSKKLVVGESYQFVFYLIADSLYHFSDQCKVYINGKIPENYSVYFGQDDALGKFQRHTMNFTDKTWHTVTAHEEPQHQPQQQACSCKYCGGDHTGFGGFFVKIFHSFLALFGLRK